MRGWYEAVKHWLAGTETLLLSGAEASEWPRVITHLFDEAQHADGHVHCTG